MATPAAPHTRTANCRAERVTSWKSRCTLAKAWMVDGDSGRLQDGEGWTPRRLHQSILATSTICYRPLASELLRHAATEGCSGLALQGVPALQGAWLGWRASAKPRLPALIASGPAEAVGAAGEWRCAGGHGADRGDQCAAAKLHRSCVEDGSARGPPGEKPLPRAAPDEYVKGPRKRRGEARRLICRPSSTMRLRGHLRPWRLR